MKQINKNKNKNKLNKIKRLQIKQMANNKQMKTIEKHETQNEAMNNKQQNKTKMK